MRLAVSQAYCGTARVWHVTVVVLHVTVSMCSEIASPPQKTNFPVLLATAWYALTLSKTSLYVPNAMLSPQRLFYPSPSCVLCLTTVLVPRLFWWFA